MRSLGRALILAVGVWLAQAAAPVRAQESSVVPPWGRDLEESQPTTVAERTTNEAGPGGGSCRWSLRAEYLLWWTKNDRIPPLLSEGSTADTVPGALGQPLTKVLYGDAIDVHDRSGGRFTLAAAWPGHDAWTVAASYLFLPARDVGPIRSSPGNPVLARPFFDAVNQVEDAALVSYPGVAAGSLTIRTDSCLQGAEGNLHISLWRGEHGRLGVLGGVRYLSLHESLTLAETIRIDPGAGAVDPALAPVAGVRFDIRDHFAADNDFFGGQIGLELDWHTARWTYQVVAKVALGTVREAIAIRGRTTNDAVVPLDEPAGLLALATNSGAQARHEFAVVSEVGGRIGRRFGEHWHLFAGYTFLYWNRVVRPGEQIDRQLNPNLIPTSATYGGPPLPARPTAPFRVADWWAQGVMLGAEFRY